MSSSSGINNATGNQAGTALHSQGVSAVQFVTSLGAGFVAFAVQFLLFLVFRKQWFTVYEARTCLVPERSPALHLCLHSTEANAMIENA